MGRSRAQRRKNQRKRSRNDAQTRFEETAVEPSEDIEPAEEQTGSEPDLEQELESTTDVEPVESAEQIDDDDTREVDEADDDTSSEKPRPRPLLPMPRWLRPAVPVEPSDEFSPRQPVLALVLAFVLPPVGAILGHLSLRQYLNRRKFSRAAVIIGWVLTVIAVMLSLTFFAWRGEQSSVQAYQAQVAKSQQELEKAVAASPSRGKVDREFCQTFTSVANMTPSDGFVRDKVQITPSLVNGFAVMGGMKTPNKAFYADYAEHLKTFDDHDSQTHTDQALGLRKVMNEDALGCIGLAMDEEKAGGPSAAASGSASPAPPSAPTTEPKSTPTK